MVRESAEGICHAWRFPERDCLARVPGEVLDAMRRMAEEAAPRETGGTLVGRYSDEGREALVIEALEAKAGARRGRTKFYRPPDDVDDQLDRVYRASGGKTHYLGEWHTHPGAAPTPSQTDLDTLQDLAKSRSVAADTPLMIIVGGDFGASSLASCTLAETGGRCLEGDYEGARPRGATSS